MKRIVVAVRTGVLMSLAMLLPGSGAAQVSEIGEGFMLLPSGSFTFAASEVVAGRASIKGSYFGTGSFTAFLKTTPQIIPFTPGQPYTVTFRYRIISAGSLGFEVLFFSPTGASAGNFLPSLRIAGVSGDSGVGTLTNTLDGYTDYEVRWNVIGTGSIAIDEIAITKGGIATPVALENAEGPRIDPGPLDFHVADSRTFIVGSPEQWNIIRSTAARDIDGDGYAEAILTVTTYPDQVPLVPLIIGTKPQIASLSETTYVNGAPTVRHSPLTLFADINGDGLQDLLFADAGLDHPPWTGSKIGVALNLGNGKYREISSLIPAALQQSRSYTLASADLDHDGAAEIILTDGTPGVLTAVLHWTGTLFSANTNWIDPALWRYPTNLAQQSWLGVTDVDGDGHVDLVVGGNTTQPNMRLLFGTAAGFPGAGLVTLPDGQFGHTPWELTQDPTIPKTQGASVDNVIVADFDRDGAPDIFTLQEQVVNYQPGVVTDTNLPNFDDLFKNGGPDYADIGLQVFRKTGSRSFEDITSWSPVRNLGRRLYEGVSAIDLNGDGFLDVVGSYSTKLYGTEHSVSFGTTFFFNDGTGAFQAVDGTALLPTITVNPPRPGQRWSLGAFLPTSVTDDAIQGVMLHPETGGQNLHVYSIAAATGIGTGPGFVKSATLGVPGFNEFYYLRRYADAAAAVAGGQYPSGLAHYLAVGQQRNYATHARVPFTDAQLTNGVTVRRAHIVELRTRVNLLRALYGLTPFVFTDSTLVVGQTPIKATHILELRLALREAYTAAGRPPPTFTDAIVTGATSIRAVHILELREAVTALE